MLGWLSLGAAVVVFAAAALLQANGARRADNGRTGLGFVIGLATSRQFALGSALDLVAVLLTAVALRDLPLFVVQAATSSSLVLTAIGSAVLSPNDRRRGLWLPVAAVTVGLALLGTAAVESESATIGTMALAALGIGVPLLFAGRPLLERTALAPSVRYATLAGLAYAGLGISLRALHIPANPLLTVGEPAALIAAGYLLLALTYFGRALQHGSVTEAMAIVVCIDTILPAGVGVWLLGDRTRASAAAPAVAGLALTVAALLWLIRTTISTTAATDTTTTRRTADDRLRA